MITEAHNIHFSAAPVEQLYAQLKCSEKGLTAGEAAERLRQQHKLFKTESRLEREAKSSAITVCRDARAFYSPFQAGDSYHITAVGLYYNCRVAETMVFRPFKIQILKHLVRYRRVVMYLASTY